MLIDGRTIAQGTTLKTDVCIVGAGAAGLTLAQEFDRAPFSVLLLESGGFKEELAIQSLADGTTEDSYPFMESRARQFGGTTTRWSGVCIPLDASDFQYRPWLPHSGWSFDLPHLLPYYQRARTIFGLSAFTPAIDQSSPFAQQPLETKVMQFSNPLNLGVKYQEQIVQSQNITLITHSNVTELIPDAAEKNIISLDIKGFAGHEFSIKPKTVILATGGIENARLLLASNSHNPKGIGNNRDLVGRFFMEHYLKTAGILPVKQQQKALFFTDGNSFNQTYLQGTLGLTDDLRLQEQLLNLHLRFYRYSILEDTQAVIAAKQLPAALRQERDLKIARSLLHQIGQDPLTTLPRYLGWHIWNKLYRKARFNYVRLQAWIEQEPDPENRITLSPQKDCLGQPKAHLTFRFSDRVWQSVEQSLKQFNLALQKQGFDPLQYDTSRLKHLTSYDKIGLHHMGTTRMHDNPNQGVVDANCKVHELANLYIAGSSVFPTGGAANPTLTIAALSLRLADHICSLYN